MAHEDDDRSRRLAYAELEAEMNAMATPERTPEVEAHFQRVFAASRALSTSVADGANHSARLDTREKAVNRSLPDFPDPAPDAGIQTPEPSKK